MQEQETTGHQMEIQPCKIPLMGRDVQGDNQEFEENHLQDSGQDDAQL